MLLPGGGWVTATFADGAFYFLDSIQSSSSNSLVRIETDGTVGSPIDILPGVGYGSMVLVPGAADLRILYPSTCATTYCGPPDFNGLVWQKITSTGDAVAPPVTLTSDFIGDTTAIGFGDDTIIAFREITNNGPTPASLMHVDQNGALVEPTFSFSKTANAAPPFVIASTGPDIVAALSVSAGIEFIQIVPGTGP